ncbi:MAG: bifunctional protein-serine/threonine kinase/phosphatase [Pseudomonadota bacterium]|nr:bifunctional protein-serine/threonine kinase/phosphatase [Pseudomonadota bacterium]
MSLAAHRKLQVRSGFATERGRRPDNQDYVGAHFGASGRSDGDIVAAIADGVGGHKGGRQAAELTVRGFIEGYVAQPATLGAQRAAARALEAINQWIHAQSRCDPELAGMGATFSCLILSHRTGHLIHVGDSRIYRLSEGRLDRLTTDHVAGRGDLGHVLLRAVGFEDSVKVDYQSTSLRPHERYLLCTDGVHGALTDARLRTLLDERAAPEEAARRLVEAALSAGSQDNATALVLDVVDAPSADQDEIADAIAGLPILPLPAPGDSVDGFVLGRVISDGRYSRLYCATDGRGAREVALKFPQPRVASEAAYRAAFVREAWVAARVRSPFVGEVVELPPGRQTRLYSAMPFYDGETLERRLARSLVSLSEGVAIAIQLARAVDALNRAGVIHRDIKPDNVILSPDGGLRLVDLGVARVPRLTEFPTADVPGTPSFMAPELFRGGAGDEASDLYALGVTVYRLFCRGYPYGEVEPFMTPRFGKYVSIARARPDLPAWLDVVLAKAVALTPEQRFGDAIEFAHELEQGAKIAAPASPVRPPLYERNPLAVWKAVALALAAALAALLIRDFGAGGP